MGWGWGMAIIFQASLGPIALQPWETAGFMPILHIRKLQTEVKSKPFVERPWAGRWWGWDWPPACLIPKLGPLCIHCAQLNELGNCNPMIHDGSEDRAVWDTVPGTVLIAHGAQSNSSEESNGLLIASLTPLQPTSSSPSFLSAPPQEVFQKTLQDHSPVTCELLVTQSRDECLGRGWASCVVKFLLGLPGCSPSLCHTGTHHGAPLPLSLSLSACPAVAYGSQF